MVANKQTPLLPAYLITGTDELKRETVLKRLRQRIEAEGDISFNCDTFRGDVADGPSIVSACNTLPFASNVRLVEVHSVEKLHKKDQEDLISYLETPADTTVLCLVSDTLAKNTRLYKAVAKQGDKAVIDCTPPTRRELPAQIRAMAVSHGCAISDSAARLLVDLVGENTIAIDSELEKLSLSHKGNDPIGDTEVAALVTRTAEAKPWEFVNAFSERDTLKCVNLLRSMDSVTPLALLAMCVTRIRELIAAQCLASRSSAASLAQYLELPDWRVKNHLRWARGFTLKELQDALLHACEAEKAMKSGSDPHDAFQQWFLKVLRP